MISSNLSSRNFRSWTTSEATFTKFFPIPNSSRTLKEASKATPCLSFWWMSAPQQTTDCLDLNSLSFRYDRTVSGRLLKKVAKPLPCRKLKFTKLCLWKYCLAKHDLLSELSPFRFIQIVVAQQCRPECLLKIFSPHFSPGKFHSLTAAISAA